MAEEMENWMEQTKQVMMGPWDKKAFMQIAECIILNKITAYKLLALYRENQKSRASQNWKLQRSLKSSD